MADEDPLTIFGETDWRGEHRRFGIRRSDRRYSMALIGRTGQGKTTAMKAMLWSDTLTCQNFALIDPHGDIAEETAAFVRKIRPDHLLYLNPSDTACTLGMNVLEANGTKPHLVASGVISVFKKIFHEFWGPRMENLFRMALLTLVGIPGMTLEHVSPLLLDAHFRERVLAQVSDQKVRSFWSREFERFTPSSRMEAASPILNKIGQFTSIPELRRVICAPQSSFDLRSVMDSHVFIANLAKGKLGEDATALLGALLVTRFELAALSRAEIPVSERRDFYLYVDEFATLATPSFAGILTEGRKFGISVTAAFQFCEQLEKSLRDALFENVGTLVVFRVGPASARILAPQLDGIEESDLTSLPRYRFYVRMIHDGQPYPPFSARTVLVK